MFSGNGVTFALRYSAPIELKYFQAPYKITSKFHCKQTCESFRSAEKKKTGTMAGCVGKVSPVTDRIFLPFSDHCSPLHYQQTSFPLEIGYFGLGTKTKTVLECSKWALWYHTGPSSALDK